MENTSIKSDISSTNKNGFRNLVIFNLSFANIMFAILCGYLLFSIIMSSIDANLGQFFGFSNSQLDIMSSLGIWVIAVFVTIGTVVLVLTIAFITANKRYKNILKSANEQHLDIVLAPWQTTASVICMILAIASLAVLAIFVFQYSPTGLSAILTYITLAVMLITLLSTLMLSALNRLKFGRLSEEAQQQIQNSSKQFQKNVRKEENKRSAGKLY